MNYQTFRQVYDELNALREGMDEAFNAHPLCLDEAVRLFRLMLGYETGRTNMIDLTDELDEFFYDEDDWEWADEIINREGI